MSKRKGWRSINNIRHGFKNLQELKTAKSNVNDKGFTSKLIQEKKN